MARPSIRQYRSQLEAQLEKDDVKKTVAELRQAHPVFGKYPTLDDLVSLGKAEDHNYEDKDAVLAILLSKIKRETTLFPLLHLMLWESWARLFNGKRKSVPASDLDELFSRLQVDFFHTAVEYRLDRRPRKIDVNLILDTRKKISRWQREEAVRSERHESFDEIETPEAKRTWALAELLVSTVFPEEKEEYLLDRVYRGVINKLEYGLIVETQVYKRMNLKEWARINGVPHATARSWLYRAKLALRRYEETHRDGGRLP